MSTFMSILRPMSHAVNTKLDSPADQQLVANLRALTEAQLLDLLRDLRSERVLENQIYAAREQWLWIPWTTCLAGALLGVTAQPLPIRLGVPFVTWFVTGWIVSKRRRGLQYSFEQITRRHDEVVAITMSQPNHPRLSVLGFDWRLMHHFALDRGSSIDDIAHHDGYEFPMNLWIAAHVFWCFLVVIAALSTPLVTDQLAGLWRFLS